MFALLAANLASTLTQVARAASDGRIVIELCSGTGRHSITLSPSEPGFALAAAMQGSDDKPQGAPTLDHCPFCCGHAMLAVLPAASVTIPLLALSRTHFPWLFYVSPRPLYAWSPARARAPPAA